MAALFANAADERDGKLMLILANLTDESTVLRIDFIKSPAGAENFTDIMSGETITGQGGSWSVPVEARSFPLMTNVP